MKMLKDNLLKVKKVFIFVVSLSVFICIAAGRYCEAAPFTARVSYVVDGDSIVVKNKKQKTRVRLWGIDTPEKDQPFSREAGRFTNRLLLGRTVKLIPIGRDDYGRLVAMVFLGRKNISEELVRSGLAWVHIYYCRKKICRSWRILEKEAREAKKGLWAGAEPVAPWKWKRRH